MSDHPARGACNRFQASARACNTHGDDSFTLGPHVVKLLGVDMITKTMFLETECSYSGLQSIILN